MLSVHLKGTLANIKLALSLWILKCQKQSITLGSLVQFTRYSGYAIFLSIRSLGQQLRPTTIHFYYIKTKIIHLLSYFTNAYNGLPFKISPLFFFFFCFLIMLSTSVTVTLPQLLHHISMLQLWTALQQFSYCNFLLHLFTFIVNLLMTSIQTQLHTYAIYSQF